MKYLHRFFLLLTFSAVIFSCQKEYSIETPVNGSNANAQWEFKEGGVQYKGPVDSVYIDTITGVKFLTLIGRLDDRSAQMTLQVFGPDLKPGTYKTPYSLFAYIKGGNFVYQTDQMATDSFTIVLTKIDSNGVAGTFSGKAVSGNSSKSIVEGKFAASFKRSGTVTPPVSTDSGQVVLWSKAGCGGGTSTNPITVTVNGKSGQITKFMAAEPSTCDPSGSYFVKLPVGNYTWGAKCNTDSIGGTLTVTKGGCTKTEVNFSAPPVASGDYFPMTKNSNWSYSYDGGSDTLFTLSTGNTASFGGKTYSLFTNTDGTNKDSSYYRKQLNTYYEYSPGSVTKDSTLTITTPSFEYAFLIDNLAANATFASGPFNGSATNGALSVPIVFTVNSTILATGASVTVNGKSYTNVIKVKNVYSAKLGPAPASDTYAVEQWFAKGIGLIKYVGYSDAPSFILPDYTQSST
ncbi:MAG TPA: hypothetical protein VL307_15620, partial [Chitinophagaceae bacterium]|nr:hypothetical protein [Chitinophagaceae bacterium]